MAELIESERSKNAILQRSQDHREEMFRVIQSGEAIAFVGAGLSHPLYPTWSQFLEKLASKATEVTGKSVAPSNQTPEPDILEYAQALQTIFRDNSSIDQYFSIFGSEFGPKDGRCTDQQRKLIRLPFKGFVTTNYDEDLEQAALDCGERRRDCGVVAAPFGLTQTPGQTIGARPSRSTSANAIFQTLSSRRRLCFAPCQRPSRLYLDPVDRDCQSLFLPPL
jgi:hypothetical protein